MFNNFVQVSGNEVIFQRDQLTIVAVIVVAALLMLIMTAVAAKRRKKDFIKTIPTNLKEGDSK